MEVVNKKTADTRFHQIIGLGEVETRKYCEKDNFDRRILEVSNDLKQRPIHLAVASKCPTLVSYLLRLGAEVDSFKKGDWTSLMVSCAQTGPEVPQIVKILLNNGADAELINKDGWTAMHIASRTGQLDTVQLLAEHRSNLVTTPSRNGRIPLHIASLNSHYEIVKFLLEVGGVATCSQPDACGSTAVLDASSCGSVKILKFLAEKTDLKSHKDGRGLNCMHRAAILGHLEVINFLAQNENFSLEEETNAGFTALMFAVMEKQVAAAKLLVGLGAAPESKTRNVYTLSRGMVQEEIFFLFKEQID